MDYIQLKSELKTQITDIDSQINFLRDRKMELESKLRILQQKEIEENMLQNNQQLLKG